MKRLFWLALLFPVLAGAQVHKCTIDGKTVYSDSLCGQRGTAVNIDANSIDSSGLRDMAAKQAEQDKAREVAADAKPRKREADPCAGIKPIDRVGTSSELESWQRCMKNRFK